MQVLREGLKKGNAHKAEEKENSIFILTLTYLDLGWDCRPIKPCLPSRLFNIHLKCKIDGPSIFGCFIWVVIMLNFLWFITYSICASKPYILFGPISVGCYQLTL